MTSASEAVERARKRVGPTADLATNMENPASIQKATPNGDVIQTVLVVEKNEVEVQGMKR